MRIFLFTVWSLLMIPCTLMAQVIETEIEIPTADNLVLKASLTLPDTGLEKYPLTILVHGSGPNNRDQVFPVVDANSKCLYPKLAGDTIRNFKDMAHLFAENGIASIRYDKRSFTYLKELDMTKVSPNDFIKDIHSVVDFAKTQEKIDAQRIILIGHSQGGNFIPVVAHERKDIALLIALGTLSRPLDKTLLEQIEYISSQCQDEEIGKARSKQLSDVLTQIRKKELPDNMPIMGACSPFWRDWFDLTDNAVANFERINTPTLILQGDEDINVMPVNAEKFKNELEREGVTVKVIKGVNHYLTTNHSSKLAKSVGYSMLAWIFEQFENQPETVKSEDNTESEKTKEK